MGNYLYNSDSQATNISKTKQNFKEWQDLFYQVKALQTKTLPFSLTIVSSVKGHFKDGKNMGMEEGL